MSLFDKFKWGKRENKEIENDQLTISEPDEAEATELENDVQLQGAIAENIPVGQDELPEPELEIPPKSKEGLLERFKIGLSKTRKNIGDKIDTLIKSTR